MSLTVTRAALAPETDAGGTRTGAWRPRHRQVADIIYIEEAEAGVTPRVHARLSITVVRSPAVVRCESSRSLVAAPNCVLVVPAGQLYSLRAQGRSAGGIVTLLVGTSHLDGLEVADRAALVTDVTLVEQVEALVAELSGPDPSVDNAVWIGAVLARLTSIDTAVPLTGSQATPLGRVRDYLCDNPSEQVTIADLTRLAGLTESHLIRAFHRAFGLPPHAYHLRRRLAAASELLASGLSVSTVAYECGFADQSHLSRKFKEVYGLTPAAWATAVATASRHKAATKVACIGMPGRDAKPARARNW